MKRLIEECMSAPTWSRAHLLTLAKVFHNQLEALCMEGGGKEV